MADIAGETLRLPRWTSVVAKGFTGDLGVSAISQPIAKRDTKSRSLRLTVVIHELEREGDGDLRRLNILSI